MRKFTRSVLAGLAGLVLVAAGLGPAVADLHAQAGAIYFVEGQGVSDAVTAVSTDVGLYVKYVGAAQTGTATVEVDASTGDLVFVVNGAADTTIGCPTDDGTIDVGETACNTFAEVLDEINTSTNWRGVYGGVIGTDSSDNTLITRAATAASGPNGVALLKDTAVALNITVDLTPNFYSGGRSMAFFLAPGGARSLSGQLIGNPYNGLRTWVARASETITSSGTLGQFAILGSTVVHSGQGTSAYRATETTRTLISSVGAATTVEKNYDLTSFPLAGLPGERILVRISSGTDLTVPLVYAYGVQQKYTQSN